MYQLNSWNLKILAYSDDITVFYTGKTRVSEVIRLPGIFCDATGAAVNWQKSGRFCHGTWGTNAKAYEGVRLSETSSDYLVVLLKHYKSSNSYWAGVRKNLARKAHGW